jgi:integrase
MATLGETLTTAEGEGENVTAIAAIRLLILTGCRKSEILTVQWEHVDFERAFLLLPDSKTGEKIIPLGAPALELLASLPRIEGNPYVLPGEKEKQHLVGLPRVWERIKKRAKLQDVRLHDLRHSFASVGAGAGMGLPIVGKLLGHRDPKTTARYAHIGDDPAKAAADRISGTIAAAMKGKEKGGKVMKLEKRGA